MRFDLITIFPEFFAGPLEHGIVRRARETGLIDVRVEDLREFTKDRHRTVDDRPFGGGEGMVMKPEPLFEAVESLLGQSAGRAERGTSFSIGVGRWARDCVVVRCREAVHAGNGEALRRTEWNNFYLWAV